MFALVDCNNFYASCERLFQPSLIGKPVVVLSNNDGCVIARSNEAKALNIRMGIPAFEIRDIIRKHNVAVFSSNYILYGDLSHRVMTTLSQFTPDIEIYSIDEAFLNLSGFKKFNLYDYGVEIARTTTRHTGLPVSIGIAPTKTLAKLASKLAKKNTDGKNVYVLHADENLSHILKTFPVGDIWGIGRRYAEFLATHNIFTAFDFVNTNKEWIKKKLTVVGLRTWEELQGTPCIDMESVTPDKKAICTSRSFGNMLTEYKHIEEAVSYYAASCSAKLRHQKGCAQMIMIFLHTNQHRKDLPQYARNIVIKLPVATNSSMELIHYALQGLEKIFKHGYRYKKAGVIVSDIIPETAVQGALFDLVDREKQRKVLQVMDALNTTYGREKVKIAQQGFNRQWKLKQEKLSPCYTTRLSDLLVVHV